MRLECSKCSECREEVAAAAWTESLLLPKLRPSLRVSSRYSLHALLLYPSAN